MSYHAKLFNSKNIIFSAKTNNNWSNNRFEEIDNLRRIRFPKWKSYSKHILVRNSLIEKHTYCMVKVLAQWSDILDRSIVL